jgi:hypothetical protein
MAMSMTNWIISMMSPLSISIQMALLAWETYVYIAKASKIDNKQKLNKQSEIKSKHYTDNILWLYTVF